MRNSASRSVNVLQQYRADTTPTFHLIPFIFGHDLCQFFCQHMAVPREIAGIVYSTTSRSSSRMMITSFSDFPCSSKASNPQNFQNGPKKPPTLLSITESVCGDIETTSDFPVPEYWVIPQIGPPEMMISFFGSFQAVFGSVASQRRRNPNPFPPMNFPSSAALPVFLLLNNPKH